MTHAPDCALKLYGGMDTKVPVECDCDAGDDDAQDEPDDDSQAPQRATRAPSVTLVGDAARALTTYRKAVTDERAARERTRQALEALNVELAR